MTTQPTEQPVEEFLATVGDAGRRADSERLCELMTEVTGEPAVMWGPSIVGFGSYRYRYSSGRTGDWPLAGFSPRKQQLVVYLAGGFEDRDGKHLEKLGPHKRGKACLYLKRLSDVDTDELRTLIDRSVQVVRGMEDGIEEQGRGQPGQ